MPRRTFLRGIGTAASLGAFSPLLVPVAATPQAPSAAAAGTGPLIANVICGGLANDHDIDLARLRLLDGLYAMGGVRTEVWRDYANAEVIAKGDLLVSYSSLIVADADQQRTLRRYIEGGGRWFAIHASNYAREPQQIPEVLGSRFITHPPFGPFKVTVTKPDDPLLTGLGVTSFDVNDELYVMDLAKDIDVLLHARWGGTGVLNITVPEGDQPLMYRRRVGKGGVLYLALGHGNRRLGAPAPGRPSVPDRHDSWDMPVYKDLIRRGLEWAAGRRPL